MAGLLKYEDDPTERKVLNTRVFKKDGRFSSFRIAAFLCICFLAAIITMYALILLSAASLIHGAVVVQKPIKSTATTIPPYFQTIPELYAGATQTASIQPFLAQTNSAPFGNPTSYIPNAPLQTGLPIPNTPNGTSIFELCGQLSPYQPSPGFGCYEYDLPPGTNITQAHLLHRHGSRYPTAGSSMADFGKKLHDATKHDKVQWSGSLTFLNDWRYTLGSAMLTANGRKELFESGVLHYFEYGALFETSKKLIARTTTQDRMLKSAEYFLTGFFGFDWTSYVFLEPQIEKKHFNTSLAGYIACHNANTSRARQGTEASKVWQQIYLEDATSRLNAMSSGFSWSVADAYRAQMLCPYETVAFGYSVWCDLFTYEEWQGFEYSIDIDFYGNDGFGSPVGRAVGIGFVEEFYARLQGQLYSLPQGATNVNYTLDTMELTFPLHQSLYFDFSHDTNIFSILTAFGLKQFAEQLPTDHIPANRNVFISHITPFAARVVWEVITAPAPVKATRPTAPNTKAADYYEDGEPTRYIHLKINQRTVPLHLSYDTCVPRDDGWCDMTSFMNILDGLLDTAQYEESCFGGYNKTLYGVVTDGVPV